MHPALQTPRLGPRHALVDETLEDVEPRFEGERHRPTRGTPDMARHKLRGVAGSEREG